MNEEQRHIEQLAGELDDLEKKIDSERAEAERALKQIRKRSSPPESMQDPDELGEKPQG